MDPKRIKGGSYIDAIYLLQSEIVDETNTLWTMELTGDMSEQIMDQQRLRIDTMLAIRKKLMDNL